MLKIKQAVRRYREILLDYKIMLICGIGLGRIRDREKGIKSLTENLCKYPGASPAFIL